MAKFLVLIYGNEATWEAQPPTWHKANAARHGAFIAGAGTAVIDANELEPTARAISVRGGPGGKPAVTDGPFLETKEIVGGYYLLDAPDIEAAVALASQIPEATDTHGGVEVRGIVGAA
jgi:hypothetical protein